VTNFALKTFLFEHWHMECVGDFLDIMGFTFNLVLKPNVVL